MGSNNGKLDEVFSALKNEWIDRTPTEKTVLIELLMIDQKSGLLSIYAALIIALAIDMENGLQTIINKFPEHKPLIDDLTKGICKRSRRKSQEKSQTLSNNCARL